MSHYRDKKATKTERFVFLTDKRGKFLRKHGQRREDATTIRHKPRADLSLGSSAEHTESVLYTGKWSLAYILKITAHSSSSQRGTRVGRGGDHSVVPRF